MTTRPRLRAVTANEHPAPRTDTDAAALIDETVDALAALRTPYWLGDTAVRLRALISLINQAERMLPNAVRDAREQGLTWNEIGQLLNLTPASAARRYRHPKPTPLGRPSERSRKSSRTFHA